jgi:hypothetical protein
MHIPARPTRLWLAGSLGRPRATACASAAAGGACSKGPLPAPLSTASRQPVRWRVPPRCSARPASDSDRQIRLRPSLLHHILARPPALSNFSSRTSRPPSPSRCSTLLDAARRRRRAPLVSRRARPRRCRRSQRASLRVLAPGPWLSSSSPSSQLVGCIFDVFAVIDVVLCSTSFVVSSSCCCCVCVQSLRLCSCSVLSRVLSSSRGRPPWLASKTPSCEHHHPQHHELSAWTAT